ncbi:MAG: protoporphyrinogen oxidase [Ktedonobacteraceae bacterium]|nr:protoporphyrinogen oxidase [Ktedonobacteraceae bacterium]
MPHIAVIGGGIAGLVAAYQLVRRQDVPMHVTLIEASDRLGGKIRTGHLAGVAIDLGPEAFVARVPEARALCQELGMEEELVAPAAARTYLWTGQRLRPLPSGLVYGVPASAGAILRSGILSLPGIARAGLDLLLPRREWPADPSVTQVIGSRLGQEIVDRLVEPLLAGIHAGRADHLSLAAVAPQLAAAAAQHRSLILGLRSARPAGKTGASPLLLGVKGGLERLVERLYTALSDVDVRSGTPVRSIVPQTDGRYRLHCEHSPAVVADGVVLAVPAWIAAGMLREMAPELSDRLSAIRYASVVTATLAYPASVLPGPLDGSGFLVPRVEGRLLTACTWCGSKWPHLSGTDAVILRCSAGRQGDERALHLDDGELVKQLHHELVEAMGVKARPVEQLVTRWEHAIPQYETGHQDRITSIEAELANWPGIVLAGASYHGVGIAACIQDGVRAAARLEAAALNPTRK